MPDPILRLRDIQKNYGGLRPLRIQALDVEPRETVALLGLDAPAAEMFVSLVTGAVLPDQGDVSSFGRSTADITDSAEWLAMLDRFGVVTDRIVLLDAMTVEQNLAVPFTLNIEPVCEEVRLEVQRVARDAGVAEAIMDAPAHTIPAEQRARVRLARALALGPSLLILEHATASLSDAAACDYGRDIARLAETRNLSVVALTSDQAFGRALGGRLLVQHPATGALELVSRWPWSRR